MTPTPQQGGPQTPVPLQRVPAAGQGLGFGTHCHEGLSTGWAAPEQVDGWPQKQVPSG